MAKSIRTNLFCPFLIASLALAPPMAAFAADMGVRETSAAVMARDQAAGPRLLHHQYPRPVRRPRIPPALGNPQSPNVRQFPPFFSEPNLGPSISGPLAPQTLGINFAGATLA